LNFEMAISSMMSGRIACTMVKDHGQLGMVISRTPTVERRWLQRSRKCHRTESSTALSIVHMCTNRIRLK
jgi:hypothetical protein